MLDIFAFTVRRDFVTQQARQVDNGPVEQSENLLAWRNYPVDDVVQQILDLPCKFCNQAGTDGSATALECMKGTPDCLQRFRIVMVSLPCRIEFLDCFELFLCFLPEDFEYLIVDVTFRNNCIFRLRDRLLWNLAFISCQFFIGRLRLLCCSILFLGGNSGACIRH